MGSKIFKYSLLPLILLKIFSYNVYASDIRSINGKSNRAYELSDGKIFKLEKKVIEKIETKGAVLYFFKEGNELYYIRTGSFSESGEEAESKNPKYIGFIRFDDEELRFEKELPASVSKIVVKKFFASRGIVYIVSGNNNLVRIGLNNMDVSIKENVLDALLTDNKLLILEAGRDGTEVNYNGIILPLSLEGKAGIKKIIDGRIVFLKNQYDTEIIDLFSMKSLYLYRNGGVYLEPEKYNLIVTVADEKKEPNNRFPGGMIYYKVFINGIESGRTETGLSEIPKSYMQMLDANRFFIIRMERWVLNKKRDRYVRANNLFQPKYFKIYIPERRIIKVNLIYDGRRYRLTKSFVKG